MYEHESMCIQRERVKEKRFTLGVLLRYFLDFRWLSVFSHLSFFLFHWFVSCGDQTRVIFQSFVWNFYTFLYMFWETLFWI